MSGRNLILLAEDDRNDAFLFRHAFLKAGLSHPIVDLRNGQQAINYLSGEALYSNRALFPLPKLLILDLKMPMVDGFEVLTWLRTRTEFKDLPAVVLSASALAPDIEKARELGARDFFVKPNDPEELVQMAHTLNSRWLSARKAQLVS